MSVTRTTRIAAMPAILLLAAGCGNEPPPPATVQSDPVRVIAEPLKYDRTRTRLEAVGTSRALRSAGIHPVTSGEVIAVNFQPGQRVARGDVLVELDRREQQLAVELAEVRLQDAERLFNRYQRSGDSGAVLPTTIDAARTAVEAARIALQQAEVELDYRTVEAPFDGYVDLTEVDPGDRINPTTLITTLDDRDSLLINFAVPEALISDVRVGNEVTVRTWSGREPAAIGEIVDIGSRISTRRRARSRRARASPTSRTNCARA
ncbi:MAG: efflux RND transporter periplasmic adaptor subunit [Woeseiaceae bacterium]|nr:efflux RND transporter periplasmic adaptor subunit [Woeseiaceae bacterium]